MRGPLPKDPSRNLQTAVHAFAILAVVGWHAFSSPSPLAGQELANKISSAARQSVDQLDPAAIADVQRSQSEFIAAVEKLRAHLSRTASPANADAWIDYLAIAPAMDGIAAGAAEAELAAEAARVTHRATGIYPGLETPAVVQLRGAAHEFGDALLFRNKEKTTELLAQLLQRSAEEWAAIESTPTPDQIASLRVLLDLLERTDQPVALAERSRQLFSHANLHITVHESLVQQTANRAVHQCSAVRDCILGTRIVGDALLVGNVTTTLRPSHDSVRLQIALDGTVTTVNKGYNGPVRLRTSGSGQVHATRILNVSESGVQFEPVTVSGGLQTRIDAIEHPWRLVRRIAQKKAAEQKPIADRIAHQRFVSRIADEFGKETDGAVAQPTPDLMAQARPYLNRLNLSEPQRSIGSTEQTIFLYATVRRGNQLAAPTPPPSIPDGNEATVQVHESIVDNTIGALLAGRTMTRTELQQLAEKMKRPADQVAEDQVAGENAIDAAEEEPEFEIDFHSSRPIIFEARDGKIRIGIQGTRFAQGSRELKRKLEIVAEYQPEQTDAGQIVLRRIGEAQVNFPGTTRLSVAQAGLRGSIKKGFADAFPETLMHQPWIIPADAKAASLRGVRFRPQYFDAQDGWLTLGVRS